MFVGNKADVLADPSVGWLDYPSYEAAAAAGAMNLHQTVNLLEDVVGICVNGVFELIESGELDPTGIDWWVTHYSSHLFRERRTNCLSEEGCRFRRTGYSPTSMTEVTSARRPFL